MKNISKTEKRKIIDFCQRNNIKLCVLFGSQANQSGHADSDIDLALLPVSKKVDKLMLIGELTAIFAQEIDLVIIHRDSDPVLLSEIFEKGICLYEDTEDLFIEKKLWAWKMYHDTKPLRDYRQNYINNFIDGIKK